MSESPYEYALGPWSHDGRCHTCATLRARVAELEAQLATARAEERERCAGIADSYEECDDVDTPTAIGAAIRTLPPEPPHA